MTENFLNVPNLPEGKVTLAAVGNYPEIINSLREFNIRIISPENTVLPEETKKHADMLFCHTGENVIFSDPSQDISLLQKEGFSVRLTKELKNSYPDDVKLNTAVGKDVFINNPKTLDTALRMTLTKKGYLPINVNQGYSKCSVCFVTENAVITDDLSIYNVLNKNKYDVLYITKGDIYLSDKHYGFFGGCTGKLDKNTLAITGELKTHKNAKDILDFCYAHEVTVKELKKGRLTDIGGILPLKEMR